MEKPKLYSERKTNRSTNGYLFISYSHKDIAIVFSDLIALYGHGLNYWYDRELNAGDKWDETVLKILQDEECRGVLFYLSENSVKSEAVEKEIQAAFKIKEQRRDFFLATVNIGERNINQLVRDAYITLKDLEGEDLNLAFPQERAANILNKLSKNILYLPRSSKPEKTIEEDIKYSIERNGVSVFCNTEVGLDRLSESKSVFKKGENLYLSCGVYPQAILSDYNFSGNGDYIELNGKKYFSYKRVYYEMRPVLWQLLLIDGNTAEFMSVNVLDVKNYSSETFFWLKNDFRKELFLQTDDSLVLDIGLPELSKISNLKDVIDQGCYTDFSRAKRGAAPLELFWVTDSQTETARTCTMRNSPFNKILPCTTELGIRPVIKIDITKL